jgi:hypothetical protein
MNTKFKLSVMAGALALAAAGQANAAVTASDLILSVWDTGNLTSYTLDTGVAMTTFTGGVTGTASTLSAASPYSAGTTTLATSATLASYLSGISSADYAAGDVQWNVVASNGSGTRNFNGTKILTTSNDPNIYNGNPLPGNAGVAGTILSAGVKASIANYATSTVTSDAVHTGGTSTDAAYAGSNYFGNQFGNNTGFINTATLSGTGGTSSQGFYFLTPISTSTTAAADVAQFGNIVGHDTVNLSSAGVLSYTVAAVPEPGEWLLMLSGFGLIGFIASRRNNQNSTMTFA